MVMVIVYFPEKMHNKAQSGMSLCARLLRDMHALSLLDMCAPQPCATVARALHALTAGKVHKVQTGLQDGAAAAAACAVAEAAAITAAITAAAQYPCVCVRVCACRTSSVPPDPSLCPPAACTLICLHRGRQREHAFV